MKPHSLYANSADYDNSATMNAMNRDIAKYLFLISGLLFLTFGFLYTRNWFNDPERVFYAAIENHVSSPGIARTVSQQSSGRSLVQTLHVQTGEENIVEGKTTLSEGSGENQATIVTRSIGTPSEDYIQYAEIETSQTGQDGEALDFSGVTGVWGRSQPDESLTRGGETFGEATLGIVPFGYLNQEQREQFIAEIRALDVYEINFSEVERTSVDGRPTYVYRAQVKPDRYVTMLQQFASFIGTSQLDNLNAKSFESSPVIEIDFEIDVWSQQLRSASFEASQRSEVFSSYGIHKEPEVPSESIPVAELQTRLQSIQ